MDQDVTEINSDCGHEHKEWKHRLTVENELVQKGESSDSKDYLFRNSVGRREFIMDSSVCIIRETPYEPSMTGEKKKSSEILSLSQVQE